MEIVGKILLDRVIEGEIKRDVPIIEKMIYHL